MPSQRTQRVGRQVLHEVSSMVELDVSDPRLELITFTEVRMSSDLRTAHVFFACMPGSTRREDCEKGLTHAVGFLRRELGRRLDLRYVPALQFHFDDSLQRAERIEQLLAPKKSQA